MISTLAQACQTLILLYVLASVIFTTNNLVIFPVHSYFSALLHGLNFGEDGSLWNSISVFHLAQSSKTLDLNGQKDSRDPNLLLNYSKRALYWESSAFTLQHGLGHAGPISLGEELFLSKAFPENKRPSKIIPYFYRSTGTFNQDDITITTIVTNNRFEVFARLVNRSQGPISVTLHVKNAPTYLRDTLSALHELYTSSTDMVSRVDVHLIIDPFDRQFNTWRNIARFFARTDFVMMLDVDFALCTDFRSAIIGNQAVLDKLRQGDHALVVPALEHVEASEGADPDTFPTDKESLLALVSSKQIGMFHSSWAVGHNSTNYKRFYAAHPGEIYKVTQYQPAYEPYVIFKKKGPPWCDERFVGYGGNKAACLFEMYLSGMSFYVLSDHFIIHQYHAYEEVARRNERKYNRRVYADFKEEMCLRYLQVYYKSQTLNTTRANNWNDECNKVKGFFSRVAAQVIDS